MEKAKTTAPSKREQDPPNPPRIMVRLSSDWRPHPKQSLPKSLPYLQTPMAGGIVQCQTARSLARATNLRDIWRNMSLRITATLCASTLHSSVRTPTFRRRNRQECAEHVLPLLLRIRILHCLAHPTQIQKLHPIHNIIQLRRHFKRGLTNMKISKPFSNIRTSLFRGLKTVRS